MANIVRTSQEIQSTDATQKLRISVAEIKVQNEGDGPAAVYIVQAYLGNCVFTLGGHHMGGRILKTNEEEK